MADASTAPAPTSSSALERDGKDGAAKTTITEKETTKKEAATTSSNNKTKNEETSVKGKGVEKMTTLPAIITDEEGTAIPEASGSIYSYRDFSNIPEHEMDQQPMTAPPPPPSRGPVESSIRVQKFPVKLYAILAQKEFADIICWMPHGRSWKVLKPNLFESLVMPLFFEYSNYHSFNRLVNAWSFRRISSGPDRGSYYHELFLRGKPYLQKYMRRLPKTHKKLPMKKEDEPDFYFMDKENPLPAVDDAPLPPGVTTDSQMMRAGGGMSPMRGNGGPHDMMGVPNGGGIMGPGGMGGYKDPLLSRHPMGMGMNSMGMMGAAGMNSMGGMGINMMSAGGMGMGNMNMNMMSAGHMGGMGMDSGMMSSGMSGMSSMGGMGMGAGMSPMAGAFRESQYGGHGGSGSASDMEFQRLQRFQMHMLDRQMGTGSMSSADQLDRMRNMEMRLGGGR